MYLTQPVKTTTRLPASPPGAMAKTDERTPLLVGQTVAGVQAESSTSRDRAGPDDLDARFKRWLDYIARRKSGKGKEVPSMERIPQFLFSVFEQQENEERDVMKIRKPARRSDGYIKHSDFSEQVRSVRLAIKSGLHPKMIQTGSSGSYFVRAFVDSKGNVIPSTSTSEEFNKAVEGGRRKTVAVFKPNDEEPYGNLNPKRQFLRKCLWWAMGRPCLIPSFSYLSEVGASLLDERLNLSMVPSTRLEKLSSSAFSYAAKDREQGRFNDKSGSYQNFLHGYVNASAFLRSHPWPSRPRDLLEQDLKAENHAHGRARARLHKGKAKIRSQRRRKGCTACFSKLICCSSDNTVEEQDDTSLPHDRRRSVMQTVEDQSDFYWTKESMQDFRLELEKLVCLDYLIRNTDRGLDNFMVKAERVEPGDEHPSGWKLTLAAIDNSLAFPWMHPAGIRSYPWGWLYLPTDLIGGNFSSATRDAFIPYLSNASWWNETKAQLESLFRKDEQFNERKFAGQMEVLQGQGWNLLESLRSEEEGPLELCARQKQTVKEQQVVVEEDELLSMSGTCIALTPAADILARSLSLETAKNGRSSVAAPASIPMQPRDSDHNADSGKDAVQPRSLQETIDEAQVTHSWNNPSIIDDVNRQNAGTAAGQASQEVRRGDDAIGKAYRGKSLGIDVLTEIDKRMSKAKRPGMRKAFTGHSSRQFKGKREQQEALSEASEREDAGNESVASLPPVSPGKPPFLKGRRRRNGSVGDYWSISSVFERRQSSETNVTGQPHGRVRVIVEQLEPDDGIAWQTWLGLQ